VIAHLPFARRPPLRHPSIRHLSRLLLKSPPPPFDALDTGGTILHTIPTQPHHRALPPRSHRPSRPRALTLVELLIGLSITTVTAAILAVLVSSTATGTNSIQDGRRLLVRVQAVKSIISDEIANSRCILAVGPTYLVFWAGDNTSSPVTPNNAVNLSELRLLEIENGQLNLYEVTWPNTFSKPNILSADSTYAPNTNWYNAAVTAKSLSYFKPNTIGTNITSMTSTLDASDCTDAKLVTLTLHLDDSIVQRNVVVGTALINQAPPW